MFWVFLLCCLFGVSQTGSQEAAAVTTDMAVSAVFDPNVLDGYQRRYKIDVSAKQEDCYFIEDVRETQKFHFHFMVRIFHCFLATNPVP